MDFISQLSSQFQNALASMNGSGDAGAGVGGVASTIPKNPILSGMHGSPQVFSSFDIAKAVPGAYGSAAYITPDRGVALQHGENIHKFSVPISERQIVDYTKPIGEQHPSIQSSLRSVAKKHGIDIVEDAPSSHIFYLLKNKITKDVVDKMKGSGDVDPSKLYNEASIRTSSEMNKAGIKAGNFHLHNQEDWPATVVYKTKALEVKPPSAPRTGEAVVKLEPTKLESAKQAAKNFGKYYAANPEEIAKGIGKGGALAAVGAGVEYGLQKAIPKTQGANYFQEVYNNLRDFGIAGSSGGVAGPLGASIGIGSELLKKTYDVGKDATGLIKYKIKSDQSIKDIEERKNKRASGY